MNEGPNLSSQEGGLVGTRLENCECIRTGQEEEEDQTSSQAKSCVDNFQVKISTSCCLLLPYLEPHTLDSYTMASRQLPSYKLKPYSVRCRDLHVCMHVTHAALVIRGKIFRGNVWGWRFCDNFIH